MVVSSSEEFWTVDNVSLHQQGWSVRTLTGRHGTPPLRGDNTKAAYVPGEVWLPKIPDAYDLVLPMFLVGSDPETGAAVEDPKRRWNDSWAFLRSLLWQPDRQFVLGRRWLRTDPASGNPVIAYAEALGQLTPGQSLAPTMGGVRTLATFDVNIHLADPFFYGAQVTSPNIRIGAANTRTITYPGDYAAYHRHLYVDLVGPLGKPRLTNVAGTKTLYCGLGGDVAAGETVRLDIAAFVATSNRASGKNRTGQVYNAGAQAWMALRQGANVLTLTATSGTGHAVVRYRPVYV